MPPSPLRWAVALTESVGATPFATHFGARPLVLWRDAAGIVRALEDRCPHRGIPLSAGQVAPDGRLACRDHGWRFDGASGQLTHVPGARLGQVFPPEHDAAPVAVTESGGFVWAGALAAAPPPANPLPLFGVAHVPLGHRDYVAALLDGPDLLFTIRHVRFSAEPTDEPHEIDEKIIVERPAQGSGFWRGLGRLVLRGRTRPSTGETNLALEAGGRTLLAAHLAPTPAPRGTTAIYWRASAGPFGLRFGLRHRIDAAALAALPPSVSSLATPPAPP